LIAKFDDMAFKFQNPADVSSPSLHEALIAASVDAVSGGAAFAFVTRGGIELYLRDDSFTAFIQRGAFELVVGIDEITNPQSLEALAEVTASAPNLTVHAFSHNHRDSIFHPKFCWYKKAVGGTLVVGSGNLTVRGLRNNWEGFSVVDLNEAEVQEVIATWNAWKTNCGPFFKTIDDAEVSIRVLQNRYRRRAASVVNVDDEVGIVNEDVEGRVDEDPEDTSPWLIQNSHTVLIAEIPRGGDRWNQGNFNQEFFESFFGGTRWDNSYRILLREVDGVGGLLPVENRQAVSVASHNWRFELGAAAGLDYPENGRPTGVFIRVGVRMFLYVLVMPDSSHYRDVNELLTSRWTGRTDRMRRVLVNVEELRDTCPSLPFWQTD
jgi:hypothetical protein